MISPALSALTNLLGSSPHITEAQAESVMHTLLCETNPSAHPQPIRLLMYTALDVILGRFASVFKSQGDTFLTNYCKFVDQEKDPRNLLVVFGLTKYLLLTFEVDNVIEVGRIYDRCICH